MKIRKLIIEIPMPDETALNTNQPSRSIIKSFVEKELRNAGKNYPPGVWQNTFLNNATVKLANPFVVERK